MGARLAARLQGGVRESDTEPDGGDGVAGLVAGDPLERGEGGPFGRLHRVPPGRRRWRASRARPTLPPPAPHGPGSPGRDPRVTRSACPSRAQWGNSQHGRERMFPDRAVGGEVRRAPGALRRPARRPCPVRQPARQRVRTALAARRAVSAPARRRRAARAGREGDEGQRRVPPPRPAARGGYVREPGNIPKKHGVSRGFRTGGGRWRSASRRDRRAAVRVSAGCKCSSWRGCGRRPPRRGWARAACHLGAAPCPKRARRTGPAPGSAWKRGA